MLLESDSVEVERLRADYLGNQSEVVGELHRPRSARHQSSTSPVTSIECLNALAL